MRFAKFTLAAVAASVANAIVQLTNSDFTGITVGKPFTITWTGATSAVSLILKTGPSTALTTVNSIVSGLPATQGSYVWTPSNVPVGTYAIEIDSGTDINYSIQFPISGGTASSSTGSVSTSKAASTSNSASVTVTKSSSSLTTVTSSGTTSAASTSASTTGSSTTKTSSATTTSGTTTSTPNAAAQYGSPFALVALGLVAIAGIN